MPNQSEPMDKNSLRDLAGKLHAQLSDALRDDPESLASLRDVMQDINRMIDQPAALSTGAPSTGAPPTAAPSSGSRPAAAQGALPDRLERIAVQFEADHPTLAASARRLVDLLGEVGI